MFNLLRYFSLASAVALTVVTVVLVLFYRQYAVSELVESAENQNVTLARSFANVLWPRFSHYVGSVSGLDGDVLRARPETRDLDAALKALTTGLPVLKVKIYDLDGLTVYSSQPSQMGADKSNNLGFLQSARDGKPASKLSYRDTFSAFSGTVENRDLVESYLPIWAGDGAIEGVFELYTDVTPLVAKIERRTIELTAGLLLSFGLLYGVLILIVRRANRILGRQYSDLKQAEEALGRAHDELETRVLERTNELRCEITERKRTEKALQESEERFRSVVNNSPTKIHIKDVEGRYVLINRETEKLFGVTNAEAWGQTTHDIFPQEQADAFVAHDQAVLQSGKTIEQEEEWIQEDGVHTFLTVKFPIRDGLGKVVAVGAIGTDITERKRTEQALRDSRDRIHLITDNLPILISYYDSEQRLHFGNRTLEEWYNRPAEEILGRTIEECMGPDGYKRMGARLEAAYSGTPQQYEHTTTYPDGITRTVDALYVPHIDEAGTVQGCFAFVQDITERKRAEEALRESEARLSKAAEMARVGYWVWDEIEDKAVYCSDELAEITGVSTGRELAAMLTSSEKDMEWVHPDDRDHVAKAVQASIVEQRGYDIEFKIIRRDGEIRHLREVLESVLDDEGNLIRSNGIIQDITERKQAEDQLRQAQKMEAVGQLTAGVAHDFNNMLAVIWGNAELLEDELGKDNSLLAALFRATKRGAELTQRLLAFSRKQILQPKTINANSLIVEITSLLRRTLEAHIDIEATTAADLWYCEVDPAQLENALVNLAINARDAMPDGGKLTIETANVRLDDDYAAAQAEVKPGHYVMLAVTDTGAGMSPEVRNHIFEPFFTTKDVGKGTGLGLSMIYGFVKQSGGHVTVYSEEGEGTTFKLYLPRSSKTEAAERKPVKEEVPVARGETVLVVEDDPDFRTLAVTLLGNLGYQVLEAASAAAALEQLGATTGVNMLLTDVVLPGGMNGPELAEELERRAPGIPVLYMSGFTEDAIMHHGRLDAGAEVLQKPFRRADLARTVRKVLDSQPA